MKNLIPDGNGSATCYATPFIARHFNPRPNPEIPASVLNFNICLFPFRPNCVARVMALLIRNVGNYPLKMGTADTKNSISFLPEKVLIVRDMIVDKMCRDSFDLLCKGRRRKSGGHINGNMRMIGHATNS